MKNSFPWKSVVAAAFLISLMFVFHVAAQHHGGPHPGGGGMPHMGGGGIPHGGAMPHGGGMPHMSGGGHHGGGVPHFGAGSVVHRNFSPPANMPRPNIRPNTPPGKLPSFQPGHRPNLPDFPPRTIPHAGPGAPGHPQPGVRHLDGPDWKHWNNFDPSRIHDSVLHRPPVNPDTINRVRNHFDDHFADRDFFSKDWFDKHPGGWHPPGHGPHPGPHGSFPPPPPPRFWWHHPNWNYTWGWFGPGFFPGFVAGSLVNPILYDYGSNVVYRDEIVYVNNVPYVDADTYYQQAQDLAQVGAGETLSTGATTETASSDAVPTDGTSEGWLSMGTFAIVADGKEQPSGRILQLATDKEGRIRGNLIDPKDDKAVELYGSVDPKTQRVAFKISGNEDCVAECGLWNLTQDTVPLLVHVNKDRTEERTLVRLKDKDAKTAVAP